MRSPTCGVASTAALTALVLLAGTGLTGCGRSRPGPAPDGVDAARLAAVRADRGTTGGTFAGASNQVGSGTAQWRRARVTTDTPLATEAAASAQVDATEAVAQSYLTQAQRRVAARMAGLARDGWQTTYAACTPGATDPGAPSAARVATWDGQLVKHFRAGSGTGTFWVLARVRGRIDPYRPSPQDQLAVVALVPYHADSPDLMRPAGPVVAAEDSCLSAPTFPAAQVTSGQASSITEGGPPA